MRVLHVLGTAAGTDWLAAETIVSLKETGLRQHVVLLGRSRRLRARLQAEGGIGISTPALAGLGGARRTFDRAETRFDPSAIQLWGPPPGSETEARLAKSVAWRPTGALNPELNACAFQAAADRKAFDRLVAAGTNPAHLALVRPFSKLGESGRGRPPGVDAPRLDLHLGAGAQADLPNWIAAVGRGPDWRLGLFGDPQSVRKAARLARRRGIAVAPATDRDPPAGLLLPHTENPPEGVIADAWASRVPIVAGSDMGGLLIDEANALLVEGTLQSEIAGQIARALGEGITGDRLRCGGRESYDCHFSKPRFLDRLAGLYARAMAD